MGEEEPTHWARELQRIMGDVDPKEQSAIGKKTVWDYRSHNPSADEREESTGKPVLLFNFSMKGKAKCVV